MSLEMTEYNPDDDSTLTSDDTLDPSISLSIGDFSVRLKENIKPTQEVDSTNSNKIIADNKWSLKRPEMKLGASSSRKTDTKATISVEKNSMDEFLEDENQCKTNKSERGKDKDDTSCDILASIAFDKYPADFENATDDDIGSILEELSKMAGVMSPNSAIEHTTSSDSSKHLTVEEKSVEELLQEAQELVRKNGLSRSASKSDNFIPDNFSDNDNYPEIMYSCETDIFQRMEQEMQIQSEKIRASPRNERNRTFSPDCMMVYENLNTFKPSRSLEMQKKRFEEQKVEVSSSSDVDDPIERHSKSEDVKNVDKSLKDKENLHQEITDVDKDFFNNLLRKSAEKAEGKISGSSSFGQEEFSQVLKILQSQSDKENMKVEENLTNNNYSVNNLPNDPANSIYPEKEITELLERELNKVQGLAQDHDTVDNNSNTTNEHLKISEKQESQKSNKNCAKIEMKNNSHNDLYTVGLTPRLELFADSIPKLIAEKSTEMIAKTTKTETVSSELNEKMQQKPVDNPINTSPKTARAPKLPEKKTATKSNNMNPSRSYDQLSKPATSFKLSLDDVRNSRSSETARKCLPPKNSLSQSKLSMNPSTISTFASKVKFSVKPTVQRQKINSKFSGNKQKSAEPILNYSLGGGDSRKNFSKDDWEILCHEERHKNVLLKNQIDSEAKLYKQQIEGMRTSFEEELFALKKQNIILKSKIDELSLNERKEKKIDIPGSKAETKVLLLEDELEKQENLIRTYETENKRLMIETKRLQEEAKQLEQKQKNRNVSEHANENSKLNDIIKDLREEILKLNYEISDLRQKNSDDAMKTDDIMQQNSLIQEELNMFKDQLRTKDRFITEKLQKMSLDEMETKRKMEEMRIELNLKTEKLRITKSEFEKFQQAVVPLEKELLELRATEQNLQEKLQVSRSHVEREKVLTQKLKDQVILDNKKILDLNRQVREMERILKRKNPDSVSALILTAKSDHERIHLEKIRLLEDRIASLEGEIKAKEEIGQEKLTELQQKFGEMREKYVAQVMELEEKLSFTTLKDRKIFNDMSTQTIIKNMENKGVETKREEKTSTPTERDEKKDLKTRDANKVGPKSQNSKEDTHLIATIRGLKTELVIKDKTVMKLTKDFQELQKTNRRLQKEREKLLNDRKNFRPTDYDKGSRPTSVGSDPRLTTTKTPETNDQNSNVYQNGNFSNTNNQKLSGSSHRLYDPLQYSENSDNSAVKRLHDENEILKEELNKMNKDFMSLKNKRLHDLNLLQEEHEREIASLVKEYSIKFGDSKVVKLQGQINTQVAVISHLKQQIEKLRDYKEQVIVLKVEREHLENKVKMLNEKVKYLVTPGTEQLQLLQDKITQLQQRHETREMTLQNLVRDLLRNKTQCRDCKGEKGKNKQLCYFRQELDHILAMLQEIAHVE
ncbi:hypothetical protein PV328_004516 [Microctonus aethiopoides]|uniref:Centrosomal protein of 162 kDa n=1 Tax=Microctonus aethiopoides TaxID=144406 RepID=A0AA39FAR0_9HYME|nr:hypothetical protein PV328_004516 [Microctonus aethiopoides]